MITQNNRLIGIFLAVPLILLVPFLGMQLTNQVNWSPADFLVMGMLLLGTVLMCEFVWRKVQKLEHRLALCGLVLLALFIVWAELAVGIFGSPFAGS